MWLEDKRTSQLTVDHRLDILDLVLSWFDKEINVLETSKLVRRTARDFNATEVDKISFKILQDIYKKKCPLMWQLVRRLCNAKTRPDDEERSDDKESGNIEGSGKMGMDSASVIDIVDGGSTLVDETGMGGNKRKRGIDEGEDRSGAKKRKKKGRDLRHRNVIGVTAMSIVLYGRSWSLNRFQSLMGYYLHAEGTSRNCMETLCAMGLSTSYSNVRQSEIANSEAVIAQLIERVQKEPFMIIWDNINRLIRVTHEYLHNKGHMINWTTASIVFLQVPLRVKRF
ncbi:hypothetical protein BGX38DRAFT_1269533 [Terfezia claveryi]|nr:hypothetical protein BGX38DRAFT_1269533 [Terfezia claveryi]